ncbi:MAG TPA: PAS domain S-box protein, partial [Anaerolineales bacterium]|nr:PAS domain S-box protein [Anaerolineales bacterium]
MEQKPLHVLLVDDDPNMLDTMRDILMAKGFEPALAKNGRAALAASQSGDIDVALIDLHLEDIPGLELLGQLRLNSPSTEGILLTGHASQDSAIQAINAGAFAYFQKPCDIDQLVLSIRRAGEKRAAGQALRESEASLQSVLQSTADGILAINRENKVLYANQRFAELWRIPPEVIASREDAVLLQHVLDQLVEPQEFLRKVQELYRSEADSFDTLYFKDGRVFERLSRPLMDGTELRGRVWSFRDVTERKKAEDALLASEERFRSLYENATIGLYRTTPDGRILMANPSLVKMLGFDSFEQLAQRNLAEKDYEPDYPRAQFVAAIEKDGYVTGLENAWRRRDGTTMLIRESARLTRDAQGHALYYDGTVEDITERKRAEEKLAEERSLLRTLIDNLPDVVYAMDLQGRKTLSNRADWQASGGKTMEDVIGKTDLELYPPELA